jgi:hypothetical protein
MAGLIRYGNDVPTELFVRRSLNTIRRLMWVLVITAFAIAGEATASREQLSRIRGYGDEINANVIGILNHLQSR